MKHIFIPSIIALLLATGCQGNPPVTQSQKSAWQDKQETITRTTVTPEFNEELIIDTPIYQEDITGQPLIHSKTPPTVIRTSNTQSFEFPRISELPPIITFNHDSWIIHANHFRELQGFANYLERNNRHILIEGHCDQSGSQAYNLVLGQKRAESVKEFIQQLGIQTERIQVTSYGEERPICAKSDESCNQLNRRAKVLLVSN